MDHQYIEDLRGLEDKKEAKAKLIEYAEQSGIKVKKSKGFDALVIEIAEGFKALADEPMPEVNEGLSISDLIDADNEASGQFVQDEVKEEARLLFDAPMTHAVEHIQVVEAPVQIPEKELRVEAPIGEVVVPQPVLSENTIEEAVAQIVESEKEGYVLPETFSPTLIKIGPGAGYCTLPWWIYDWILQNEDWKEKPDSFPHHYGIDTVKSLIYYIKREGQVRIRETRNSRFIVLN